MTPENLRQAEEEGGLGSLFGGESEGRDDDALYGLFQSPKEDDVPAEVSRGAESKHLPDAGSQAPNQTIPFGEAVSRESVFSGRLGAFVESVPGADVPVTATPAEPERQADAAEDKSRPGPAQPSAPAAHGPAVAVRPKKERRLKTAAEMAEKASFSPEASAKDDMHAVLLRYQSERERLWQTVSRILSSIAAEGVATQEIASWKLTRDPDSYKEQRRRLEELLGPIMLADGINVGNPKDLTRVFDVVYDELVGIGPLGPLWRDDTITEILVDGWDSVSVERDGKLERTPVRFRDKDHANQLARDLASSVSDRALNISNPLVTAELDRARANFAYGPVVKSGLAISLRKFRPLLSMSGLLERGALNEEMRELLRDCVLARATVVVSGGTGTGKTTMLNALSEFIPDGERVVTIEDSFELGLANLHVVSLQTKERASADDTVRITMADLLVNSLRMRPDRIVVGEIREPHGARAMVQAATTGHDGTMTTIHANTAEAAISDRLSDLQREATGAPDDVCKRVVASAVDLVVQVTRKQGVRYISDIAAVDRSMVKNGMIVPESIYTGDLDEKGTPVFRRSGGVRADTEIGSKLAAAGEAGSRWEAA